MKPDPSALLDRVDSLLTTLVAAATEHEAEIGRVHPSHRESARNLVHYLALRRIDLRRLQMDLVELGLSSLGRSEGHVLATVAHVRARLRDMLVAAGETVPPQRDVAANAVTPARAEELLHHNARTLFGPRPDPRHVYVMVTLPDAIEVTADWAREVITAGASCFRLNTAHDTPEGWERSIRTLRGEATRLGREIRILVDLEGPKLRTLALGPGVFVHKLRPPKDELGRVAGALAVALTAEPAPNALPVPADALAELRPGDELRFLDARGKKRKLVVTQTDRDRALALLGATSYLTDQTEITVRRAGRELARFTPGQLPHSETSVGLRVDDQFWLVTHATASPDPRAFVEIPISLPEAFGALAIGHRVLIDDGRLEGVVVERDAERALVRVVAIPTGRFRVRGEMGINLPDTALPPIAMSAKDHASLELAIEQADMVGLSFVRSAADVRAIRQRLDSAARPVGIVLKIETGAGFRNLGELLLEAMRYHPIGVMIARGDLAVEVGFERLAELQEEILWLSEAAHVPVIWATQVLENLAKTGMPSRGEVTDAAMSVRAECVMLNKGPFVARAVKMLASILERMERHTYKKMALYRGLRFR
jgi:pyruvate kinase